MNVYRPLMALSSLVLFALVALPQQGLAQAGLRIGPTNQIWRFHTNNVDLGTDWRSTTFVEDDTWQTGRGLFGRETTAYGLPIVTDIVPQGQGGPSTVYFRTKFMWSGSTEGVLFAITNYIDDGDAVYLNGTQIYRFNTADDPVFVAAGTDPGLPGGANPPGEPVIRTPANNNPAANNETVNPVDVSSLLVQGENVIAVHHLQAGTGSSDTVFGLSILASQCIPPNHDGIQPTNRVVLQGRNTTLQVVITAGLPAPGIQWFRNVGAGDEPIAGATGASLTLSNFMELDAGQYFARLTNQCGSIDSRRAQVNYMADMEGPMVVEGFIQADLTNIVIVFNEDVTNSVSGTGIDPLDNFTYSIRPLGATMGGSLPQVGSIVIAGTTVRMTSTEPLSPMSRWEVSAYATAYRDVFENPTPNNGVDPDGTPGMSGVVVPLLPTVTFQEGFADYMGTQDTELRGADPDQDVGQRTGYSSDQQDASEFGTGLPAGTNFVLIRFDNIIGNNVGQIPPGATILSATLTMRTTDAGNSPNLHRMLVDWNESSTWNSMNGGIQFDNVEAATTADATNIGGGPAGSDRVINVRAAVQAWANGTPNFGWVLNPTGTDGQDFNSSEAGDQGTRPKLDVRFTEPPPAPIMITQDLPASIMANERDRVVLQVVVTGSSPMFQWFRNNMAIPGATSASLTFDPAVPGNSGTYKVVVTNNFPPSGSMAMSRESVLTVSPDSTRPRVVRTQVNANLTSILLSFSEPLATASAESTGNYILTPSVAVSSAVLQNGTNVLLTTAARTLGTSYNLRVQNVTDTAVTPNPIDPNPTDLAIQQTEWKITDFGATWKYETNNLDGQNWQAVAFDDSAWPMGPGPIGVETAGAMTGANLPVIATTLFVSTNQQTYYYRGMVTTPAVPAGSVLMLVGAFDDGAVIYVDGAELARFDMPTGAVTFATVALAGDPDEVTDAGSGARGYALNVPAGPHVIAVEVHQPDQTGGASSDTVFAVELAAAVLPPPINITYNADGSVTVTWNASSGWRLTQSNNVSGPYNLVAGNPSSPYRVATPTGNVFFQLRYALPTP
jgi:hypothetical protein